MFVGLKGLEELCIDRVPSVTDAGACVIKGKGQFFLSMMEQILEFSYVIWSNIT